MQCRTPHSRGLVVAVRGAVLSGARYLPLPIVTSCVRVRHAEDSLRSLAGERRPNSGDTTVFRVWLHQWGHYDIAV